jgi:polar amino acid transport system substrate-binding protein
VLSACATEGSKEVKLNSQLSSEASTGLAATGALTVGVDTTAPPFAANANGKTIGLDVDIAEALSSELGLELVLLDVNQQNAEQALADNVVDVVMNISQKPGKKSTMSAVGPYMKDGPAIFTASLGGSVSLVTEETLKGQKIGVTSGSATSTVIAKKFGAENMEPFMQLSKLFEALGNGTVTYAASDIIPGAYLSESTNGIAFAMDFMDSRTDIYLVTSKSDTALTTAVTNGLGTISSNGVLRTVINKWVGDEAVDYVVPD